MIKPLFDVFKNSMLHNPKGSRKEAQDHFIKKMKTDPTYLEMLARDYFDRMAATWTVRENAPRNYSVARTDGSVDKNERRVATLVSRAKAEPRPAAVVTPAATVEEKRQKRAEAAKLTAAALDEMKASIRNVVLLDLMMPDGKLLRDATGASCAKAGGFFAAVGKSIKPTQVVDRHLSEGDLQNIRSRYYQANKEEKRVAGAK